MKIWLQNVNPKLVTMSKVLNYFSAKWRVFKNVDWEGRQAAWRLTQVEKYSPICFSEGYCKVCYCEWKDGKHYETDPCDEACYPRWLDYNEWMVLESVMNTEAELDFINFIYKKDKQNEEITS